MSLQIDGFLSTDSVNWIAKHRTEHVAWFNLADRLNHVAQKLMLDAIVPKNGEQSLLVLILFARALSAYQGAILLVERAMTIEARTLARSCLESSFYLGAVANDLEFVKRLINADMAHKKKIAEWLTNRDIAITELPKEKFEEMTQFIDDLKSSGMIVNSIVMQQAAQKAELGDIYEVLYRDLSDSAAHPSLASLRHHTVEDSDGNFVGLRFGPDPSLIRETIVNMTTALFCSTSIMTGFFPNDSLAEEVMACWELHKRLVDTQATS